MKRTRSNLFYCLFVVLLLTLTACGTKSQEDVIASLEKKLAELSGYKMKANMTLLTGKEPQTYEVEVWHKADEYYRVALTNETKEQSQIILRNDDGVFVLTPSLNKSFRFQSEWPKSNSQFYLYDSLITDILSDAERTFTANEAHYVFETNTNYQNKNLSKQEIALHKKDLSPATLKIMNHDHEVLVEVAFTEFNVNESFSVEDFDTERNMTASQIGEVPTFGAESLELVVHYPLYEPLGTELLSSKTIQTEQGEKVVLTYGGEQSFTLIQETSRSVPASAMFNVSGGELVDLGFTIGVMTDDSIMWSYNGVDFLLASNSLSTEEMMAVARSVYGVHEK